MSSVARPQAIDEDAVRRLLGPAFAQADAFQRAGHVLGPRLDDDGLLANVRGVWHRQDRVAVGMRTGRLFPNCERDGAVFCRHVGALLLQWLRAPSSFVEFSSQVDGLPTVEHSPVRTLVLAESPTEELARLLERETVPRLRELGRRRGVRLVGSKKVEILAQVVTALADPAAIDTVLATLSPAERLAIDAAYLVGAEVPAQQSAVAESFRLLGGGGDPPLTSALDAGLVIDPNPSNYGPPTRQVPRAVVARLAPVANLARSAKFALGEEPRETTAALGIVELLQIVALEFLAGPLEMNPTFQDANDSYHYGVLPPGFAIDVSGIVDTEDDEHFSSRLLNPQTAPKGGFLVVPQHLLAEDPLARLMARTGQSGEAIDFAVRLMLALEIVEPSPTLTLRPDRLQNLLELTPGDRLGRLIRAWLATAGPFELGLSLTAADSRLRLRWQPSYATWHQPLPPAIASAARLIARMVGRMPPNVWHDLPSFVASVERLTPIAAPRLAQLRTAHPTSQAFTWCWLADRGSDRGSDRFKEERLALKTPEAWPRVLGALVNAILTGPLRWLGLVDVVTSPGGADGANALRVRPVAGILTEREPEFAIGHHADRLVVSDDLSVLVPAGTTDVAVHGRLARAGELLEASSAGLRYRLTPAGMQTVFDTGTTGPEFSQFLSERTGRDLPRAVRATLDAWWAGYGAIRLYDELTLIELGDDLLLTELLAATPLATALVYTFSPRLIAVDPARTAELVAALTSRGYAPRVIEEP